MNTVPRVLLYLAVGTAIGLVSFSRRHFDALANGLKSSPIPLLIDELTAAWLAALLVFGVVALARRFPVRRYAWLYLAGAPVYAVLHTLGMFGSRSLLYPAFGLGRYEYGDLAYRFLMEAPVQLLGYGLVLVVLVLLDRLRKAREAERLEALLARAQLDRLRLTIGPHFLFNTLNVISAAAYESPEKADELIGRLSRLLRALVARDADQTCRLDRELSLLDEYLALQRARFEDRLEASVDCPPELASAEVPFMILQPLVENALQHGRGDDGRVSVHVTARRSQDRLILSVTDRGPGPTGGEEGIGTGNTRERVDRLYGSDGRFNLRPAPGYGAMAELDIPYRCAS